MALDLSSLSDVGALLRAQDEGKGLRRVRVDAIYPDPNQPRKTFDEESLAELAESIRAIGIIQPPVVRGRDDGYLLIAGERRWRAARQAGLELIDVIVRDDLSARAQLIENIQREALSAWEIYRVISSELKAGTSQADLARALGKSRAWVSMYAAIDKMPQDLVIALCDGRISGVSDLGQLQRLITDTPNVGTQLLRASGRISRSMIENARRKAAAFHTMEPAAALTARSLGYPEPGSDSQLSDAQIAANSNANVSQFLDSTRETDAAVRRPIRIRVHHENRYWTVDYLRQQEIDGVVSVVLISDDATACLAPIEELRLHSIECI